MHPPSLEKAMLTMFFVSIPIGYFTMPTILGFSSDVRFHLNKVYGAILMGSYMALVELFMHGYTTAYQGWAAGWILLIFAMTAIIYFQIGITENEFLRGMIEHHGMGIKMASRVLERDDLTQDTTTLAKSIVDLQRKEITQIDELLEDRRKKYIYRKPQAVNLMKA
jgi:hypothetical protein